MRRKLFLVAIVWVLAAPARSGDEPKVSDIAIAKVEAQDCRPGTTVEITIRGQGFREGVRVSFPASSGLEVTGQPTVVSPSEIRVTVKVARDAQPGPRDVTVTGAAGEAATLRRALAVGDARAPAGGGGCLPDRICARGTGAGNRAMGGQVEVYLYVAARNLVAAPAVEFVPSQGLRVLSTRLLDPETVLVRVALDRNCPPGLKQIILSHAKDPGASLSTGSSVNVMASLTDAEVRDLDRQIMRRKWEKYRKQKSAGETRLAAAWMHAIIRELGLLPGANAGRGDEGDKDTSAILFGLEEALKGGADAAGRSPIPTETLNVLLELYKILDAIFDPRTKGGKDTIRKKLERLGITGDEALDMIDELEAVWKGLGKTVKK